MLLAVAVLAPGCGGDRDEPRRPAGSPSGANDFSCEPGPRHPRPVVLVHGTFNSMRMWKALAPRLADDGYCVFALNHGARGTRSIPGEADRLARFVDRVRDATGAGKVDVVGYSQGSALTRWYLRFGGGARRVHALVAIAPSNHGTDLRLVPFAKRLVPQITRATAMLCRACREQLSGSEFMKTLNAGGDTMPGVTYTTIRSAMDEVVVPSDTQRLSGPRVKNILLQDTCTANVSGHLTIPYDPDALGFVMHALDPGRTGPPRCARAPGTRASAPAVPGA